MSDTRPKRTKIDDFSAKGWNLPKIHMYAFFFFFLGMSRLLIILYHYYIKLNNICRWRQENYNMSRVTHKGSLA